MHDNETLDKPWPPARSSNESPRTDAPKAEKQGFPSPSFLDKFVLLLLCAMLASCTGTEPPPPSKTPEPPANPLLVADDLLSKGKPIEAIHKLNEVSWTVPEGMAARRLISDICTRIELNGPDRPRIDLVEVIGTLPHDPTCFTEGLEVDGDTLLESCGLNGESRIRRVNIQTGAIENERQLGGTYFGEGVTRFGDATFVLTWIDGTGFVFDPKLKQELRRFPIRGQGWGMTHDATHLIYSNGTHELGFLDPNTGAIQKSLQVFNGDLPLMNMNELEYVDGELLAVIYPTERIARIDPTSGKVIGWILAEGLLSNALRYKADVLNGIAYDPVGKRYFLAGKLWPTTFIVRFVPLTR